MMRGVGCLLMGRKEFDDVRQRDEETERWIDN